jgi:7-keto-8-aminopelargonate synthetase-like enzyme
MLSKIYDITLKIKILWQSITIIYYEPFINKYELMVNILRFDDKKIFKQLYVCYNKYFGKIIESPHSKYILFKDDDQVKLNVGSYDYLGNSGGTSDWVLDKIKKFGFGKVENTTECEKCISKFLGKEDTILCSSGYSTNANFIKFIVGKDAVCFVDKHIHTSTRVGLNYDMKIFDETNLNDLEQKLKKYHDHTNIWIFVEGIYSMEGTICNLPGIVKLKNRYNFKLFIDEAHSIGALGKEGKGVCQYYNINPNDVDVLMGTFSKSFASQGGYICSSKSIIDNIRSYCDSYDLEMNISVPCYYNILDILITGINTTKLLYNTHKIRDGLKKRGYHIGGSYDSPVIPIIIPEPLKIIKKYNSLWRNNIAVIFVGPPATKWYSMKLRLCVNQSFTVSDIDKLLGAFDDIKANFGKIALPIINVTDNEEQYSFNLVKKYGIGTCGPFLFFGTNMIHKQLEQNFKILLSCQSALLFPSALHMKRSLIQCMRKNTIHLTYFYAPNAFIHNNDINYIKNMIDKHKDKKIKVWVKHSNNSLLAILTKNLDISIILDITDTFDMSQPIPKVDYLYVNFEKKYDLHGGILLSNTGIDIMFPIKCTNYVFSASLPIYIAGIVNYHIKHLLKLNKN